MRCSLCEKRPAKRFCPAKQEKICAVCCGTEREVTLDCPSACPYLQQARRYDAEHRPPPDPADIPFPQTDVPRHLIHERRVELNGLGLTILQYARQFSDLTDSDVLEALQALAETYRTLGSGILYERPPAAPLPQGLYAALGQFLNEAKKADAERAGFPTLRDSEVFLLLVFLLRVGRHQTSGRRRSRAFLDFLRAQYASVPESSPEAPRIIVP